MNDAHILTGVSFISNVIFFKILHNNYEMEFYYHFKFLSEYQYLNSGILIIFNEERFRNHPIINYIKLKAYFFLGSSV